MARSWQRLCRVSTSRLVVLMFSIYMSVMLITHLPVWRHGASVTVPEGLSVDDVIAGQWRPDPGPGKFRPANCRPQHNVAFVKCMKCATETMGSVLRRYSFTRRLSVVLPVGKRIYLGWPYPITHDDYRPSSRGFNFLVEHAIYNAAFFRRLMNPGTAVITMIREPLDMFTSALNYFNVFEISRAPVRRGVAAVRAYLRNIHRYEAVYQSSGASAKRYCIPDGFSVTKNLLAHCLGMPLGFPPGSRNVTEGNPQAVHSYMRSLDSELTLVMIMEYFDESLVLLRRLLCWSTKDIVYRTVNKGAYHHNVSSQSLSPEDRRRHREWSGIDYTLYDFFNASFWAKVRQQGDDFAVEVDHFKWVQRRVTWFCHTVTPYGDSKLHVPESAWSPAFTFSSSDCRLLSSPLLDMLKSQYEEMEPELAHVTPPKRTGKNVPLC